MYESFFKLARRPFQLSPDPEFFFGSSGHKRVLAYLRYGLQQGEGFIVVTGEVGSGKTTLVKSLLHELEGQQDLVAVDLVSTQLEADDLLIMVANAFDIPHENTGKGALLKCLQRHMQEQAEQGKRMLLIVDEAQNLGYAALEELRMLSNFQMGNRPLFQSFLLGQRQFRDILRKPELEQLRQRVIASYHLGPMDLQETGAYIEHRLKVAGWKGDPSLTEEAYELIYDHSGGIPRQINLLCDRLLLTAYLEETHTIDRKLVSQTLLELQEEVHTRDATAEGPAMPSPATESQGTTHRAQGTLEERVERIEAILYHAQQLLQRLSSMK
ncbi:MAG TPA: DUF2075 domain-containing protein [Thiotrichales bacterium]|nr:DUF2075 domain-containing protein [Thiotrichales bacterium]